MKTMKSWRSETDNNRPDIIKSTAFEVPPDQKATNITLHGYSLDDVEESARQILADIADDCIQLMWVTVFVAFVVCNIYDDVGKVFFGIGVGLAVVMFHAMFKMFDYTKAYGS